MLNLGDINVGGGEASQSFEDAYADWLEADTQFVNLMNALEIAEKASSSESSEVKAFAEDLLGCSLEVFPSMEVKIRPGKIDGKHFGHIQGSYDEASQAMYRTVKILHTKINSYPKEISKKVSIKVPDELVAIAKRGMQVSSFNDRITRTLTYSQAITVCKAVTRFIINNFDGKHPGSGIVEEIGHKTAKDYLDVRKFAAGLLAQLRKVMRQLDQAVKNK